MAGSPFAPGGPPAFSTRRSGKEATPARARPPGSTQPRLPAEPTPTEAGTGPAQPSPGLPGQPQSRPEPALLDPAPLASRANPGQDPNRPCPTQPRAPTRPPPHPGPRPRQEPKPVNPAPDERST